MFFTLVLSLSIQTLESQIQTRITRIHYCTMLKTKTHRIISISPTTPSQHQPLKSNAANHPSNGPHPQPHNKTMTPIKQIHQHATRTNTIKSTLKPDESCEFVTFQQGTQKKMVNACSDKSKETQTEKLKEDFKPQKLQSLMRESSVKHSARNKAGIDLDQILNKIGQGYQEQRKNQSGVQLLKKTQINYLREIIRHAKLLAQPSEDYESSSLNQTKYQPAKIENVSDSLRKRISGFFTCLHKELYLKQKQIYECLDQKIFELKQKNITKFYQAASLKNYAEKCESDINSNYQKIINQLDMKQLNSIVDSYSQKLEYYMEKARINYEIKINLPQNCNVLGQLSKIVVQIQSSQHENMAYKLNDPEQGSQKLNRLSLPLQKQCSKPTISPLKSIKTTIEQLQNLPLSRLLKKPKGPHEHEPRISSARGKY